MESMWKEEGRECSVVTLDVCGKGVFMFSTNECAWCVCACVGLTERGIDGLVIVESPCTNAFLGDSSRIFRFWNCSCSDPRGGREENLDGVDCGENRDDKDGDDMGDFKKEEDAGDGAGEGEGEVSEEEGCAEVGVDALSTIVRFFFER